ncbi:hypothetical protein [Kitasatospora cheerisanensis]|nr:hypothetical protein [Kitasatospora cheerisanensis]
MLEELADKFTAIPLGEQIMMHSEMPCNSYRTFPSTVSVHHWGEWGDGEDVGWNAVPVGRPV